MPETPLNPQCRGECPDACPCKWKCPSNLEGTLCQQLYLGRGRSEYTYYVGNVPRTGENDGRTRTRCQKSADGPEKRQSMQHLSEIVASHISEIQALSELCASGAVNCAHVFDDGVDPGAEGRATGER
jgi:hypothetical protein